MTPDPDLASLLIQVTLPDKKVRVPYFMGRAVRRWFFSEIERIDPELAIALDSGDIRRPYTVSTVVGLRKNRDQERRGWLTISALNTTFSTLLKQEFTSRFVSGTSLMLKGEELYLFNLNELYLTVQASHYRSDSYSSLWERLMGKDVALPPNKIGLQFDSSTTSFFDGEKGRQVLFPLPELVMKSLAESWNEWLPESAPTEWKFDSEYVEWLAQKHMTASHYENLSTFLEDFEYCHEGKELCFKGKCAYTIAPDQETLIRYAHLLVEFACYCGIGRRTTYGLGQAKRWTP